MSIFILKMHIFLNNLMYRKYKIERDDSMKDKMSKKEFISYVAKKYNVSEERLNEDYDMLINGITDVTKRGIKLSLTGFGAFYLQKHKGHPVQFDSNKVKDYVVFKFSASNVINQQMRQCYENGDAVAVNETK